MGVLFFPISYSGSMSFCFCCCAADEQPCATIETSSLTQPRSLSWQLSESESPQNVQFQLDASELKTESGVSEEADTTVSGGTELPKDDSCYLVTVEAADEGLGLRLVTYSNHTMVKEVLPNSVVGRWNRRHPGCQVKFGDEVLAVNGTQGSPGVLLLAMKETGTMTLLMHRTSIFRAAFDKGGEKVQLQFEEIAGEEGLRIVDISGLWSQKWAQDNPGRELRPGDIISQVNGSWQSLAMIDSMRRNKRVELLIYRFAS